MKQTELAHYRAMLQTQGVEPPRRSLFGAREKPTGAPQMLNLAGVTTRPIAVSGPPPTRAGSLFGRRPREIALADEAPGEPTLLLDEPAGPAPRLRLHAPHESHHLAETPYHAEDLADPPAPAGPIPGVIAGWSNVKPPSAQTRLLRRLGAVLEAERHGLAARLAAAGIDGQGARAAA